MYVCMYFFQSFHLQNKYTIQLSFLISSPPFHCTSMDPFQTSDKQGMVNILTNIIQK